LIRARSRDAAVRKAHKYGKHEQIPHNLCSSTIDDRPVRLKYAGIRKLSLVECPESGPESGTLLSKFVILPKRTEDLKALVGCEEVDILLYPQEDVISINESTTE